MIFLNKNMLDNENLKLLARQLRREQTISEKIFWNLVKNRRIKNEEIINNENHVIQKLENYL